MLSDHYSIFDVHAPRDATENYTKLGLPEGQLVYSRQLVIIPQLPLCTKPQPTITPHLALCGVGRTYFRPPPAESGVVIIS
jgi:hypothetical protein